MLESERQSVPTGADEASWLKRITEINAKQERLLNLHLDGDVTTEQFRAKRDELKDARIATKDQLEAARSRLTRLKDLECSKDALILQYASLVPQGHAELSPEEKNRIYKMMRFHLFAHRDGTFSAEWGCNVLTTPQCSSTVTTSAFRFRALLTAEGAELKLSQV